MKRHHLSLIAVGLSAAILSACAASDSSLAPEASQAEAPAASQTPAEPATPAPAPSKPTLEAPSVANFTAAPAKDWIIRSNCRMGECNWYRFDQVERTGGDQAPNYNLHLTAGDSTHPQDPYPNTPVGANIRWQSATVTAEVLCSHTSPYAAVEDHGEQLQLNPQGVSGAAQGLANVYFATCHGEFGNDAELARKFGYNLR